MHLLIAAILAANPSLPAPTVPQTVAHKALSGDFGPLAEWQQAGYKALQRDATKKTAWVTAYSQFEPGCGTRTASGRRVEEGRTAAMLGIPFGSFVLIDLPAGYTLRQVWDRGSKRNLPRARARGAETWVDIYRNSRSRKILNASHIRSIWIVKVRKLSALDSR